MTNEKELDYLNVLKAINELPFGVGKKLLSEYLQGNKANETIKNHKLHRLATFGALAYSEQELNALIENLIANKLIEQKGLAANKFWKVFSLTEKGKIEINNPTLHKKRLSMPENSQLEITEEDKKLFNEFDFFLSSFNEHQKKAITSNSDKIICIAGAGSGKTTVLTKRIEFLIKYRSVDPSKILGITFTRKARHEMAARLSSNGLSGLHIETFNSFCEKILKINNDKAYTKQTSVMSYPDKIKAIRSALAGMNITMERAIDLYFDIGQRKSKTPEQLAHIFINDCFALRDYLKLKNKTLKDIFPSGKNKKLNEFTSLNSNLEVTALVGNLCTYLDDYMGKNGLRDYADQLLDTIALFKKYKEIIPVYEHILIDEYQDVNNTQIELISLLSPKNIFCVGDPRQSIFGWRGSDIKHIVNFSEAYPESEMITLTKNYRSKKGIVDVINRAVKGINLPDLHWHREGQSEIHLIKFDSEQEEFEFVMEKIKNLKIPKNEIFVLARTNRQLNELSALMKMKGIRHITRNEEKINNSEPGADEVTLSTIHAIKGLEAHAVFLIGCTPYNFPCRASEHPIIEMLELNEYDTEEEEKRLLYVAMSRAKDVLYMTYAGKSPTHFITDEIKALIGNKAEIGTKAGIKKTQHVAMQPASDLFTRLKRWRSETSQKNKVPAYIIMHDSTLIEIAQAMPASEEALLDITGMGPAKISRYGKEIIAIINGR